MIFKPGQTLKAVIPFAAPKKYKVHIMYVLDSVYADQKLIIYKVWGRHKQWWHEFMCSDSDMKYYVNKAKGL